MVPPPATTDQVGEVAMTLPFISFATAVNCCVVLMGRVALGDTVMLVIPGAVGDDELQAATRAPAKRTATASRAVSRGGERARRIRFFMGVFIAFCSSLGVKQSSGRKTLLKEGLPL